MVPTLTGKRLAIQPSDSSASMGFTTSLNKKKEREQALKKKALPTNLFPLN